MTKEYKAKWYQENKEKVLARAKIYYENNKEKIKKDAKRYQEENKEKVAKTKKKWVEANSERVKERKAIWHINNKERTKEQRITYAYKYRTTNKDKIRRGAKQYRDENREMLNTKSRNHYAENKEELQKKGREYQRLWAENNKDKMKISQDKQNLKRRIKRKDNREAYFKKHGCCPPIVSSNDTLYIWEAVGELWDGVPIFKIGTTSKRLNDKRIHIVASKANLTAEIHLIIGVSGESATTLENRIHNMLPIIPNMGDIDGKTEFRACSYQKMKGIIEMIDFDEALR